MIKCRVTKYTIIIRRHYWIRRLINIPVWQTDITWKYIIRLVQPHTHTRICRYLLIQINSHSSHTSCLTLTFSHQLVVMHITIPIEQWVFFTFHSVTDELWINNQSCVHQLFSPSYSFVYLWVCEHARIKYMHQVTMKLLNTD